MLKKELGRVKLTGYFLETFAVATFIIMIIFYLTIAGNISSVEQSLENFRGLVDGASLLEIKGILSSVYNLSSVNLVISLVTILFFLILSLYLLRTFLIVKGESLIDHLTGLYNRRFFISTLNKEIIRAKRFKHPLSVILLDIDHFKIYNDKYGHKTGDRVLRVIAKILMKSVRKIDTVFRYGGEEFAIIVPETSFDEVSLLAERIRYNVEISSKKIRRVKHPVTISLGAATYKKEYKLSKMVDDADKLLYEAKSAGRNVVKKAYFGG